MKNIGILVLLLPVLISCKALYASPVITIATQAADSSSPLRQAAEILNVPQPANWTIYVNTSTTTGFFDEAQVGSATITATMTNWSIPDEFREKAIASARVLVFSAAKGTFTAQTFTFDTQSDASFTTLIVITRTLHSSRNSKSPVYISYVTINSNATVKQQYTTHIERKCRRCFQCFWIGKCCCWNEITRISRGNTPEELEIIRNKIRVDQFAWFNQQIMNKMINDRHFPNDNATSRSFPTAEAIEHFLSDNLVQEEVLSPYSDPILSTLQNHLQSLTSFSQSLKLTEVPSENILTVLSTLAEDYGFEDDFIPSPFLQQLEQGRTSYENLFTVSIDQYTKYIKYIWIVGQNVHNSTYSIHFLSMNIIPEELVYVLLSNGTLLNQTDDINNGNQQLRVIRTSLLTDDGQFLEEYFLTMITPWQLETTETALNILRYTAATALFPQDRRRSSYSDWKTIPMTLDSGMTTVRQPRFLPLKILHLTEAVLAVVGAAKNAMDALRVSTSKRVQNIVRFGFTRFAQNSTVFEAIDIPADGAMDFVNALATHYNLPAKGSFTLGLTYSKDFAWDKVDFLYSPQENGKYNSLTLFKNGDSTTNTASFFVVHINADWQLANDLLLIQTSKSYLGGIFESTNQSIREIPHALTMDEAVQIQQFFMLMALSHLAPTLGLNTTLPELNSGMVKETTPFLYYFSFFIVLCELFLLAEK